MLRVTSICLILALVAGCAGQSTNQRSDVVQYQGQFKARQHGGTQSTPASTRRMERGFQASSPAVIRRALLAEHERWNGTPYRLGGEGPAGIDCSALVQTIFSERFHIDLPRTTEEQAMEGQEVTRDELQVGDLVFFRPPGVYRHVGVYVGDGYFLHVSTSQGVKLSELDNTYWRRHYWQARRPVEQTQLAQRAALGPEG